MDLVSRLLQVLQRQPCNAFKISRNDGAGSTGTRCMEPSLFISNPVTRDNGSTTETRASPRYDYWSITRISTVRFENRRLTRCISQEVDQARENAREHEHRPLDPSFFFRFLWLGPWDLGSLFSCSSSLQRCISWEPGDPAEEPPVLAFIPALCLGYLGISSRATWWTNRGIASRGRNVDRIVIRPSSLSRFISLETVVTRDLKRFLSSKQDPAETKDDKLWDTRRWQVPEYQSEECGSWAFFCFGLGRTIMTENRSTRSWKR